MRSFFSRAPVRGLVQFAFTCRRRTDAGAGPRSHLIAKPVTIRAMWLSPMIATTTRRRRHAHSLDRHRESGDLRWSRSISPRYEQPGLVWRRGINARIGAGLITAAPIAFGLIANKWMPGSCFPRSVAATTDMARPSA